MRSWERTRMTGKVAAVALLVLTGCGGPQGRDVDVRETGGAGGRDARATEIVTRGEELYFLAVDKAYIQAPSTADAGLATVVLDNRGSLEHNVVIDALALQASADGGQRDETEIELRPGTYIYYCKVPGHREDGMEGELTVGDDVNAP